MLMYMLSILGVMVVAGLFTAWVIHEIYKNNKPDNDANKRRYY